MNKTSYHSKLVGVSHEGRQDVIALMEPETPIRFRREPDNPHDDKAVAVDALVAEFVNGERVYREGKEVGAWKAIGYIAADKNSDLARLLDDGMDASIKVSDLTGGGINKKGEQKNLGVNVYIEYAKPRKLTRSPDAHLEKDMFGNSIFYDDVLHQYTNSLGEVYLSGSKYAGQFEAPFPAEIISNAMAKKNGLGASHAGLIRDMWALKAEASASLGTAIHAALELYGRFKGLAESVGKETHFHDNPILKHAVATFYEEYPDVDDIEYEALVVDHAKKRAGRIDRLEFDKDGSVWITDFKTNADIEKSLDKYWLQLSFYAAIIKANGLKVRGLKIYHYTGEDWTTIVGKVIDIDKEKK